MRPSTIDFRQGVATLDQVEAHLCECSDSFSPPLADRVDPGEYAVKLLAHAARFEAWADGQLVGLVAAYFPTEVGERVFITNVSVKRTHMGRGIATTLVENSLRASARRRYAGVELEVNKTAARTVAWYTRLGFVAAEERADTLLMRLDHEPRRTSGSALVHPYASEAYAHAFAPTEAVYLPGVRTHVLKRRVAGTPREDAMGCYPLFVFDASARIEDDFAYLRELGLVSLVGVTDCLTQPSGEFLGRHFDARCNFKTHHIHDASLPGGDYSKHHRARVRRARRICETRLIELSDYLDEWCRCYDTLVQKRGITGIQAFPRTYFECLSRLSEAVTIGAFIGDELTSAHIWFRFEGKVYAHLAASTPRGYKERSAFAVYDHAIQMFRDEHIIDFGGGAGFRATDSDGLSQFKKGFANTQRRNYLCGKVLDAEAYNELSESAGVTEFFPAYRKSN